MLDAASNRTVAFERAVLSLNGLSVGDAFGQCFFQARDAYSRQPGRKRLPHAPWLFTDDTEMSLSVVAVLAECGAVDQDRLANSFAWRYSYDRAYGPSMHRVLARIRDGESWRAVAADSFAGQGSFGNGAAMRAAPVGAYFADDPSLATEQARLSAIITHSHPEGGAGAMAVALAAAEACRCRAEGVRAGHSEFLALVIGRLPPSEVRSRLVRAQAISKPSSLDYPVSVLGNGVNLSAQDTVPYALWCCGQALDDYQAALWLAAEAGGDSDTLCAIVGGVVACFVGTVGVPEGWKERREPFPEWVTVSTT